MVGQAGRILQVVRPGSRAWRRGDHHLPHLHRLGQLLKDNPGLHDVKFKCIQKYLLPFSRHHIFAFQAQFMLYCIKY
jgi:hypothetical protein